MQFGKNIDFETNEFTQPLAITGWTYETANTPTAGEIRNNKIHIFNTADGTYTEEVPTNAGTYYVKAIRRNSRLFGT